MDSQWPEHLDWQHWADRFDRMQERYSVAREERFEIIVRTIRAVCPKPRRALDLGCGTGSLGLAILHAFPQCELVGIDLDTSMLILGETRMASFGHRVHLLAADLRGTSWLEAAGTGFDAVVSATALHWLSGDHLTALYHRLPGLTTMDGIFLNADHVASDSPEIQKARVAHRDALRKANPASRSSDTWDGFWTAYAAALGRDAKQLGENSIGTWEGVEEGLPLAWHFDRLREAGFTSVDCFWRSDCDAIYGGRKAVQQASETNHAMGR